MNTKRVSMSKFSNSQNAIKEYIDYHNCDQDMRKSRVIIELNGIIIHDIIVNVYAAIGCGFSYVDIFWNKNMIENYFQESDSNYQVFTWFYGTLSIDTEDRKGNKIQIIVC